MQKLIPLNKIKPNPFRNMDTYPINEAKVQTLCESYGRTGYWGNLVGRENEDGVELAFGHHRRLAMQRSMKVNQPVEIIVKPLSDEAMLKMMADENMSEWGTSSIVEQETIRAVVQAYADGKVELPKVKRIDRETRNAPGFCRLGDRLNDIKPNRPYTAESIARFLGWMCGDQVSPRVRNALLVLETAESLNAPEEIAAITTGLSTDKAKEAVQKIKNIKQAHEARGSSPALATKQALKAGKALADGMRNGGSIREAREAAERLKPKTQLPPPTFDQFIEKCIDAIEEAFRDDSIVKQLAPVFEYKEYLSTQQQKRLITSVRKACARGEVIAQRLEGKAVGSKFHLIEE